MPPVFDAPLACWRTCWTPIVADRDSLYQPVERPARRMFASMPVPKKLQAALPFASKPKLESAKRKGGYFAKRAKQAAVRAEVIIGPVTIPLALTLALR